MSPLDLQACAARSIADVSHELRSPLSVVKEYCSLVHDGLAGPTTAKQREFLGVAIDRIEGMSRLVDDMLDMSKIAGDSLPARRERASIDRILCAAWPALERRAAQKQLSLELADDACGEVYCDIDKANRTLINLAINAIKFTPAGGRVIVSTQPTGDGAVRIAVTDSGPGIAAADLEAIFKRFEQLSPGRMGSVRGYGLGLSIARELAGLNLGELTASSEPGRGSTFAFTLPSAEPAAVFRKQLDSWLAGGGSRRVSLLRLSLPYGAGEELHRAADDVLQSFPASEQFVFRLAGGDWLVAVRGSSADCNRRRREFSKRWSDWRRHALIGVECELSSSVLGAWRADADAAALCENFASAARQPYIESDRETRETPVAGLSASIADQQRLLEAGARFFLTAPSETVSEDCGAEMSLAK